MGPLSQSDGDPQSPCCHHLRQVAAVLPPLTHNEASPLEQQLRVPDCSASWLAHWRAKTSPLVGFLLVA